jgi:hypothetical protein
MQKEKIFKIPTNKGVEAILTEDEMKEHEETLRRGKILRREEGKKAVESLEDEVNKALSKK